jgi:hypothetical protein
MLALFPRMPAAAALLLAAVALGACDGGSWTRMPPQSAQQSATVNRAQALSTGFELSSADPTAPYVYACDGAATCYVFNGRGKVIGTVTGLSGPTGTATDPSGNWYIADTGAGTVLEYSPGGGTLEKTLIDTGESPFDVAVSTSTKTVAVVNGDNSISVYVGGAKTPTRILRDPGALHTSAMTVDRHGNCYIAYYTDQSSGIGVIDKFAGCSGTPARVGPMDYFYAMAFDGRNNLYYSEFGYSSGALFKCQRLAHCQIFYSPMYGVPSPMRFNRTFGKLIYGNLNAIATMQVRGSQGPKPFATIPGSNEVAGVTFAVGPSY